MGKSQGEVSVRGLLRAKGVQAVGVLADLMQDTEAKPEIRFKAAEKILDRALEQEECSTQEGEQQSIRFEGELDEWSR